MPTICPSFAVRNHHIVRGDTIIALVRSSHVYDDCRVAYSRWENTKKQRREPIDEARVGAEQDFALGQLIYDLRTAAGLSQRELAERMGTTQSVISRLEEGGGARNRLDTLGRVAVALDRHLVVSFPEVVPKRLKDAVQVA